MERPVLNFLYSPLGVKYEYPNNPFYTAGFIAVANIYAKLSGLEIQGSLPKKGGALIIGNHIQYEDALRMVYVGVHNIVDNEGHPTRGRMIHPVGKSTLFGIPEPEAIRKRTGKKDLFNSDHPLAKLLVARIGAILYGVGGIPVIRGTLDRRGMRAIEIAVKAGQLVAISLVESRVKTGSLEEIKPGAALLLQRNPEIPYYLAGVSKDPNLVKIGKPLTYARLREERGGMNVLDLTMELADSIIDLLPAEAKEKWSLQRPIEADRLYSHQKIQEVLT